MKNPKLLLILVLAWAASFGTAGAQTTCPLVDDGFNAGCCNPANPMLPPFPQLNMDAKYACLHDCSLEAEHIVTVAVGAPQMVLCDYAVAPISVTPTGPGGPTMAGTLLMKYSRTWMEPGAAGVPRQIYRWIVNVDMAYIPGPAGFPPAPCPTPPEAANPTAPAPVHFVGHVDYACDPISPATGQATLSLTHLPGCISHAPFSTRPLSGAAGHPDRSYHLVAPSCFSFTALPTEPSGILMAEATRPSSLVLAGGAIQYTCLGEVPVVQGSLSTMTQNCLCSTMPGNRWAHQNLVGVAQCSVGVANFASLNLPGFVTPTGLTALRLGSWSCASYPGTQDLFVYWGVVQYPDFCNPFNLPIHVVTGVGTRGAPVILFSQPTTPVGTVSIDLVNSLVLGGGSAGFHLGWGGLFASDLVFNLNLP